MTNAFDIPMNDILLVAVRYCIRSLYKLHKLSVVCDNITKHLIHTIFNLKSAQLDLTAFLRYWVTSPFA